MGGHIMRRGHFHTAKLQNIKMGFMDADALLLEDGRAGVFDLDDQCKDSHRNRQHQNPEERENNVNQSLKKVFVHASFTPCSNNYCCLLSSLSGRSLPCLKILHRSSVLLFRAVVPLRQPRCRIGVDNRVRQPHCD